MHRARRIIGAAAVLVAATLAGGCGGQGGTLSATLTIEAIPTPSQAPPPEAIK